MKKIKKILSGLLAVSMILSVAGCKKDKETVAGDNVVTVKYWHGSGGSKDNIQAWVDEFNATKGKELGVVIECTYKQSLSSELPVAFQTNQQPDIFTGISLKEAAENGYILAYEDLPGGKEYIEEFKEYMVNKGNFVYKDKTYTLPTTGSSSCLIYNKDLFKKAGIVDENGEAMPPKTWKEFREVSKRISDLGDNYFGTIFCMKWGGWFEYEVSYPKIASDGYCYYDFNNDRYDAMGFVPILEEIKGIIDDKTCYPGSESIDNDPARAKFAGGTIGMKVSQAWDCAVFNNQFVPGFDWGVAPVPVVDENEQYYQLLGITGTPYIGVTLKDKLSDDKIMELAKWFSSEELLIAMYECGDSIPCKPETINKADVSKMPKRWNEFGEINKISRPLPSEPRVDITGKMSLQDMFFNEVLNGDRTITEICEEFTKTLNDGVVRYDELYPDDSSELYKNQRNDMLRK